MAQPRSYAQIIRRKQRLGLEMINLNMQSDFVFASLIIEMCKRPQEYCLIKQRDRRPDRAIGYHPGEVWGTYDESAKTSEIILYLWPLAQKSFFNAETGEPIDCTTHKYLFPKAEFLSFLQVLTCMLKQKDTFEDLQNSIITTPVILLPE